MHISVRLYTEEFDFPRRKGAPSMQVMIATMPRSGSTAFCLELWRTGLLGAPLEYTNPKMATSTPRWTALLQRELKYWKALQRVRTGPNGVFSYKFFVHEYVEIMRDRPNLIPLIAPTHIVYLTREDKLAQAISYSKAIRSGAWFANEMKQRPCEYDEGHIQDSMNALSRQEQAWEQVFDVTQTRPLRVTYEEFVAAPAAVVEAILEYVVPGARTAKAVSIPQLDIQRDTVSDNWRERFLARAVCGEKSIQGAFQQARLLSQAPAPKGISGFVAREMRNATRLGTSAIPDAPGYDSQNLGAGSVSAAAGTAQLSTRQVGRDPILRETGITPTAIKRG